MRILPPFLLLLLAGCVCEEKTETAEFSVELELTEDDLDGLPSDCVQACEELRSEYAPPVLTELEISSCSLDLYDREGDTGGKWGDGVLAILSCEGSYTELVSSCGCTCDVELEEP
jgi:hypothetical protein